MTLRFASRLVSIAAISAFAFSAQAATDTVNGSSFSNGTTTYSKTFADGLVATFTAGQRTFEKKSLASLTGVGISGGRTAGEIDIGETITGSFSKGVNVSAITLGLLFDGPEYHDVNEVAQITAHYVGGGSGIFTLTATGTHTAIWSLGTSGVTSIGSGAVLDGTGAWTVSNPFGNQVVSSLTFTALTGLPGASCTKKDPCTNQSDYTFISLVATPVTAVPEPETYALLLAGLGLIGGVARRRQSRAA